MDVFKEMTVDDMVKAIDEQIAKLDNEGSDDIIRLRRDLEKIPDDASLWFDLGIALNQAAMQRDYLVIERAQLLNPDADHVEVDCAGSTPIFEQALEAYAKTLELEPDYYGVQTQRGIVFANLHRLDEAEQAYLQALREDDEDFSAAFYLSQVYADKGDEVSAQKYAALARQLNPDGAE